MKQQAALPGIAPPAPRRAAHDVFSGEGQPASPGEQGAAPQKKSRAPRVSAAPTDMATVQDASLSHDAATSEQPEENNEWPPTSDILRSLFIFEPTTIKPEPIVVLGLDCARPRGLAGLAPYQRELAEKADIICAGKTLLEEFAPQPSPDAAADAAANKPSLTAQLLPLTIPLESILTRLSQLRSLGKRVLVLADGDPLLFGIGATLVRHLGADNVLLLPAVSSLQQACARLALPWHRVICLSLHGRDELGALNTAFAKATPLCVLTDARMSPDVLARHMLDRGVDWFRVHVFERMGAEDESHADLTLPEAAGSSFGPACTMLLIPKGPPRRPWLGLETADLATERGLISKKAVRATALALLQIKPRHVVWDIGSGSGAVALEACVLAHDGHVIAIERSAGRAISIQENRRRFGAAILDVCLGNAPECLTALPDPHRVFIGGGLSGQDGEDILHHVCRRLPEGGRLVASCILLDSVFLCRRFLQHLGWEIEIIQVNASANQELGSDERLVAQNPVFLLAATKPSS